MSLSRKIAAGVDELARTDAPFLAMRAEDGPHCLEMPISLATAVGVECQGFDFRVAGPAARSLDDLKAWGIRLSRRVTYLMEPLGVLEADPVGDAVVLRSRIPTSRNGRRMFYEIRLDRGGLLRFERMAFDESSRRRQAIPCQFTTEVLERLVDDLVLSA